MMISLLLVFQRYFSFKTEVELENDGPTFSSCNPLSIRDIRQLQLFSI